MSGLLAAIALPLSIAPTTSIITICSIPIIVAGLIKLLIPTLAVWRPISVFCSFMIYCWRERLMLLLYLNPWPKRNVEGLEDLGKKNWYLLISNHHSWADIVVLCVLFRKRILTNKCFPKRQPAWILFIDLACWALGMPSVCRYPHSYLIRHPERRGKDVETTRRSYEKFRAHPTTIINFVEGSCLTEAKKHEMHSSYDNPLPPRAAGIAMALSILGSQFNKLPNITLYYPENNTKPSYNMLSGHPTRIVACTNLTPIGEELHGDCISDKNLKHGFQRWLNELWEEKDRQLTDVMQDKEG